MSFVAADALLALFGLGVSLVPGAEMQSIPK